MRLGRALLGDGTVATVIAGSEDDANVANQFLARGPQMPISDLIATAHSLGGLAALEMPDRSQHGQGDLNDASQMVWQAPVPAPGKIVGVGHNYSDLLSDLGMPPPDQPKLFAKWSSTIVGPGGIVRLPPGFSEISYEAELAVVIGATAKHISPEQALSYVFGYTIANDVTAVDAIRLDTQFTRGKNFDTFLPTGPWIVEGVDIANPNALAIELRVNGVVRQNSSTSNMIFPVAELVSFVSGICTLEPGDMILTGTPTGVARQHTPPAHLTAGDEVEIRIERLGVLDHGVV